MAISCKDIEVLWKRYSEEGVKQGISVAHFFESNGVPYHVFEKWYKKRFSQPDVASCVVSGTLEESHGVDATPESTPTVKDGKMKAVSVSYVNIGLINGIKIEHHRLSYEELVGFINKIQTLCLA